MSLAKANNLILWETTCAQSGFLQVPTGLAPVSAAQASCFNYRFQRNARSDARHAVRTARRSAKTIKAGVYAIVCGENNLIPREGSIRYFTLRESARPQTFPNNFAFQGSWSEAMRQLENAVAVKLATVIARNVRECPAAATKAERSA